MVEVAFLAAVAAGVTVARFHAAPVIAIMALAWVLVALLEWAAWRDVPHYGRGLPPRYYVPQVALPPPRAVEQRSRSLGYPAPAVPEEEATWIAPAGDWGETLVDWPVLGSPAGDETEIIGKDEPDHEHEHEHEHAPTAHGELTVGAHHEPAGAGEAELQVEEPELVDVTSAAPEPEVPRVVPLPMVEYSPVELRMPERVERPALHHIDPLATPVRKGWFRRPVEAEAIEVRDGPPPGRALPGAARSGSEG